MPDPGVKITPEPESARLKTLNVHVCVNLLSERKLCLSSGDSQLYRLSCPRYLALPAATDQALLEILVEVASLRYIKRSNNNYNNNNIFIRPLVTIH
jgi:hypothetical protein